MTASTYTSLITRANQIRTAIAGNSVTASFFGTLVRDIIDSLGGALSSFSVVAYGADPTGVADPTAAFAAADAAAAAVGGTVYVPKGIYGTGADWSYALSSGVKLEGDGNATVLLNCYVSAIGTAGSELVFTAPAAKGATSISIPATGLSGSWVRLTSCINMQSTDAGRDQLGHDPTAAGFFAEYQQILAGSVASATLSGATLWAYSNTPGADSGSFTTSTARVMSFHSGSSIRSLKFLGKNSAQNFNIEARFAKGLVVENVTADCNDITDQIIRFRYCLDCHVIGGSYVGKRTSIPVGSTANPIVFISSQACTAKGVSVYYGNQGVDIDCVPNDATYRGGPGINCGAVDCQAFNCAADGFTSHWGCYGSFFQNPRATGCLNGVRLRDRGSSVSGGKLRNNAGTGIGVLVDNAAVCDSNVEGVEVVGFLEGVQYNHSVTGYATLEGLLAGSMSTMQHCKVRDCLDHGVYLNVAYTAATMVGPKIVDNDFQNCTDNTVQVSSYWNGAVVDRNRINGVASGKAGVRYAANIKRLEIGINPTFNVNAAGFGLQGAGTGSFMTDLTTFPLGEAEAFLYIGPQRTDAATPFQSLIRDVTAYAQSKANGYAACISPMGTAGPTAERQTFGFYLSGSSLRADTRDTSNAFVTHQLNIRGAGTPEGAVTAGVGSTYQRTDGGAGTSFYVKESGAGNTGWVAK